MNEKKTDIFILGPGRIGLSLCILFERAGLEVAGIWGRREASRKRSDRRFATPYYHGAIPDPISDAGIVLITTADRAIEAVSGKLAESGRISKGTFVYHCSGAYDSGILHALRSGGAKTGTIHPLQAVPSVEAGLESLPSSCFILEGDAGAVEAARVLVAKIGGTPLRLPKGDRALYHAAASAASNYLVTLLWGASKMLAESGLEEGEAVRAFLPMVSNVVGLVEEYGSRKSLTGPIARGDIETVRIQLEAVERGCPEILPMFATLASSTIDLVQEIGRVDETTIEAMRQLLDRFKSR